MIVYKGLDTYYIYMEEKKTQIQISEATKKRLQERRRVKMESYDEVINHQLDVLDECLKKKHK